MLSLSRLVLAAAFVARADPSFRVAVILVAALTDWLDGFLARRSKRMTRWGALLDPITDRIFVFAAVCVYLAERQLTGAQYLVLIFRDLMTAIGFVVARNVSWLRPITFRARLAGKLVTALQLVVLVAVLVRPALVPVLIPLIAVLAVIAVVDYTLLLWRERART
ncbi:MAG: CDP-alcohol phosphatidyltransferase family protein [Gemmatimonadetes bacterium]|nr:CDP-alcohol phosphatidyltransferase family protein [Gemmatimonadota bacterium]